MPFPAIDAKPAERKKWFFKLIHLRGHNYSGWNTRGRYMKYLSLLILLIISFILFMIGIFIPGPGRPLHIIFVVAGVILGFIFYLLTFRDVLTTRFLRGGKRIFWIVAIVCVPMIGNLIYIILQSAFTKKQVPKPQI